MTSNAMILAEFSFSRYKRRNPKFSRHRRRYGVRRVVAELKANEIQAGAHKVRKVLKEHGLQAIQPRSFVPKTADSRHAYSINPNLLLKRSLPSEPDEVWVGDITYIPMTGGTYAYVAVWMDLYSRKIIGWHLDDNMKEALVIAAFRKALKKRKITDALIIHSDRGGQYAGGKFRKLIHSNHLLQSMSWADNPYEREASMRQLKIIMYELQCVYGILLQPL